MKKEYSPSRGTYVPPSLPEKVLVSTVLCCGELTALHCSRMVSHCFDMKMSIDFFNTPVYITGIRAGKPFIMLARFHADARLDNKLHAKPDANRD